MHPASQRLKDPLVLEQILSEVLVEVPIRILPIDSPLQNEVQMLVSHTMMTIPVVGRVHRD